MTVGDRHLDVEDKLVEVEGTVTARELEDIDSGRREQAGNLLERGNSPEEDGWGRGDHCLQCAEELRDSQTRTFSELFDCLLYFSCFHYV